jgi:hypothetical protein
MLNLKYIKLYEEINDSSTWNTVRDTIQSKKPFLIIICKDEDSKIGCKNQFSNYSTIEQKAFCSENMENLELPSLFIILNKDTNIEGIVKTLFNKFSIKRIIAGDSSEYVTMYYDFKNKHNLGNELVSDLAPTQMEPDEYFKIDSTYYKFINYNL